MQALYNGLGNAVHYKVESSDSLEDIAAIMHLTKDEFVEVIQAMVDMDQKTSSEENK